MGDQASLFVSRKIWDSYQFLRRVRPRHLRSIELQEPLEVSRDVRPPVQMRRGTRDFSRASTEDSDIPTS